MDLSGEWLPGILQNWVADLLWWVVVGVGGTVMVWARAHHWRWADPLSYGLVTVACLYILLQGFRPQGARTLDWLLLGALFVVSVVLLLIKRSGESTTHSLPREDAPPKKDVPLGEDALQEDLSVSSRMDYVRPLWVKISPPALAWSLPSVTVVLQGVSRLKQIQGKIPVRIIADTGGRPVADLLVQMLQLTDWPLHDDPDSASYVFPLPHGSSLQGIRVRCRDSLSSISYKSLFLESELESLFSSQVKMEPFPETDAYNFIQIEIGSLPSSLGVDHL